MLKGPYSAKIYELEGERRTLKEWARIHKLHSATLYARLRRGYTISQALDAEWRSHGGRPMKLGSLNFELLKQQRRHGRMCPQPRLGIDSVRTATAADRAHSILDDLARPCGGAKWRAALATIITLLPEPEVYHQWGTRRCVSLITKCLDVVEAVYYGYEAIQ